MAKPSSTAPGSLGHSMALVTSAFLVLTQNGVSPEIAFVLAVAAVFALR